MHLRARIGLGVKRGVYRKFIGKGLSGLVGKLNPSTTFRGGFLEKREKRGSPGLGLGKISSPFFVLGSQMQKFC